MKQRTLFILIIFSLIPIFNSCNKNYNSLNNDIIMHQEDNNTNTYFNIEKENILSSIDSLNNTFKCNDHFRISLLGWLSEAAVVNLADKAGSVAGAWAGRSLGASVGVITANPVVGCAGYLVGGKIGGAAGYVAASYGAAQLISETDLFRSNITSKKLNYSIKKELTAGDIHNRLLDIIEPNNYKIGDSINISKLYDNILIYEQELGIIDTLSSNPEYRNTMISFCNDAMRSLKNNLITSKNANSLISVRTYFLDLKKSVESNLDKTPKSKIEFSFNLIEKLSSAIEQIDKSKVLEYEQKFTSIVENSNLSYEDKDAIKTIGQVSIGSSVYWKE